MPHSAQLAAGLEQGRLSVLVVEEDAAVAARVRAAYAAADDGEVEVVRVGSLAAACEALARGRFHLILADLRLPDARGLAALEGLLPLALGPVIAVAEDDEPGGRDAALAAGAYDFVARRELAGPALVQAIRRASLHLRTEASLRDVETRYRSLVEQLPDALVVHCEGRFVYANPAALALFGARSPEALLGREVIEVVHPEDREHAKERLRLLREPAVLLPAQQYRVIRLDGETVHVEAQPLPITYRGVPAVQVVLRDISARVAAEARARRLSGLYAALSATNEAILHAASPEALYARVCDIAVEHGFGLAAVRLIDRERRRLTPVAVSGGAAVRSVAVEVPIEPADSQGLTISGIAARTGTTQVANDIESRPIATPGRAAALAAGIKATASLPFRRGPEIVGVLSLFSAEAGYFDEELLKLLERMVENLSFALDNLDREERRRQAEGALRESEARFRHLTELSSDWYWEQDGEFRFTFMSGRLEEKTGTTIAQHLGRRRWDVPALNLTDADWARHREQLERHEPFRDFEIRRPDRDGRERWVAITGEPVVDADGRFCGYRGVGRDMTGRKLAEAQLVRLSRLYEVLGATNEAILRATTPEELYQRTCDVAVDGRCFTAAAVVLPDAAGRLATPVALSGAASDFLRGLRVALDESVPEGRGLIAVALRTGASAVANDYVADARVTPWRERSAAYRFRAAAAIPLRREGTPVGVLFLLAAELNAFDAEMVGLLERMAANLSFALDGYEREAERRRAEQALRESEERFRSLTDLTADWYWEQDEELRFTRFSGGLERHARGTPARALGRRRWEVDGFEPLACSWDEHRRTVEARLPFRDFEYRSQADGGAARYFSVSGEPVFDADGRFRGYRGIARDVTARKHTEQQLALHAQRQEWIGRFGQRALESSELDPLFLEAVQTAGASGADAAAVYEFVPASGRYVLRAALGPEPRPAAGGQIEACRHCPLREALDASAPVVVADARVTGCAEARCSWQGAMRSAVNIRIRGEDGVFGVLAALAGRAGAFTDGEVKFLHTIGNVLSTAVQRRQAESRLAQLAQYDALTGLPNRNLLRDRIEQAIARARRQKWRIGMLFIDLDRFKLVNDTLGHEHGDRLLEQVGERLRACVRASDTVARFSGDEFVVVLPDLARAEDAGLVAQKILDALAAPFDLLGQEASVGASIGVALYPEDTEDGESLLKAADAAMYRAKESGRAGYCYFTSEMNRRSYARLQLQTDLRRALERAEFRLVYQPKIELASGRVCGAEALLRWAHPERGMVAPGDFIPVLEETGLILPAGEWVVSAACAQLRAWREAGLAPVPVAVNVSARQFRTRDLDTRIIGLIEREGVDPRLLEIEITESYLMQDPEHAIRILEKFREVGIQIAIDDFGTGYSSLAYLTRFPVSALKVDRQFVRDATSDPSDAAIVRAVIDMAHNLGFVVVAEGVETEAQVAFLRRHGCDLAQGFHFARPMPPGDIAALLAAAKTATGA